MRILVIHNIYGLEAPSGENGVFKSEVKLLKKYRHEVEVYTRQSDEIRVQGIWGEIKAAFSVLWNPFVIKTLNRKIRQYKPDIVHVHNTFPLISNSMFYVNETYSAMVLSLHNYRNVCPNAIPLRNNRVCVECFAHKFPWPAIVNKCYRKSFFATFPIAVSIWLHKNIGTWIKKVDAYICLTEFQKKVMIGTGIPEENVLVKPNFYLSNTKVIPWKKRKDDYAVFVGRLSAEKGIETLINTWRQWGDLAPELRVIGDGPLAKKLKTLSDALPVKYLGNIILEETQKQISAAKLLILPSEWYETFGLVVIEAFAHGTPAAVSDIGSLPTIVQNGRNGLVFKPGDPDSLLKVVRSAWETPGLLERLGAGARKSFEEKYTEEANYKILMSIYEHAIETRKSRNGVRCDK